jgi:hypothetical protein
MLAPEEALDDDLGNALNQKENGDNCQHLIDRVDLVLVSKFGRVQEEKQRVDEDHPHDEIFKVTVLNNSRQEVSYSAIRSKYAEGSSLQCFHLLLCEFHFT